ncbi:MAG: type VI secretion system membrane subunit TssM [Deltaproteobacteria bacterium]|nr:type VI secretion system membrane subunit TssM [Deltaproteobacteria bacterium]
MWLWILAALFLVLVWGAWYILQPSAGETGPTVEIFPTWVAILITAIVVLALVGLVVYRRMRAARAARALEKAIAQQAQEQVLAAKPENREEIQALQKQMLDGIKALKASRLGEGRVGGNALYALPWYAIVGPPGAGKTTALRHSGLTFPFLDPAGGGVRGVGGTRNCDWWFTNDAVLLDTAGRYTTEQDDREEWLAFLEMLRTYRRHKPLNGVMVAVAANELCDASEDEVAAVAERVRDRIDEMQMQLRMVLPVYVIFTKCDLVAGFVEFFGDLKRSERAQIWGATVKLAEDKSDPAKLFHREFDLLVEQLHKRAVVRLAGGRTRRPEQERIYQFPLEFAAIRRNLADFLGLCFKPAPPPAGKKATRIPDPILRGFYFTSGTQEGKPLERVVGAMGRAFGLRLAEREERAVTEPKSYFLHDVFAKVAFPDQDLAGRTEDELRRGKIQRLLVAAGAAALALLLVVPAGYSYRNNKALIDRTREVSEMAAQIDWLDGRPPGPKIDQLDTLRQHVELLDAYRQEGAPLSYRWGMYQGDRLYGPALEQYIQSLRVGFILPVKAQLEAAMKRSTGAKYLDEYQSLKTYLLLDDVEHLQDWEGWHKGRLTREWASLLRAQSNLSQEEMYTALFEHVRFYVDLVRRTAVKGEDLDHALIARTRDVLTRVGPSQRYYDQFVTVLIDERIDEAGPDSRENLAYPPITVKDIFADRPDVLTVLGSKQKKREGKWREVQGPYTYFGHQAVLASLRDGYKILEREKWVVPLTAEEKQQGDKIKQSLARVRQDYDEQYITQWREFFQDVDVVIPTNNVEAIQEFKVLSTPDWPYWRMLRVLRDNSQFERKSVSQAQETTGGDGGVIDQIKRRLRRKIESKLRTGSTDGLFGGAEGAARVDPVPERFKSMVDFGLPEAAKEGEPPPPAQLAGYVNKLEKLAGAMTVVEEGPPNADTATATQLFQEAVADAESKLLTLDRTGQVLMRDLLLNPLRQSYRAMVFSAGGAASGLWEVVVWPPYRDTIRNRYPFNALSKKDASFEDAVGFFRPKDGILWGFYETYLKGFHRKVGHKFVPNTALSGSPRPAQPYTPFKSEMYGCLERADEITDALWPGGGADAKVLLHVNLVNVSPVVSEITLEVDGEKKMYRNEKEFWKTFQWPGPNGPIGPSIRVRGAGGLDEEIKRDGPWGIFRLFEAGTTTAKPDDDAQFIVTWQMAAPPVQVTMQVRPQRANHPFSLSFFRDTNCPPSIGDRFGPGGPPPG